jgi:hypothetical protein
MKTTTNLSAQPHAGVAGKWTTRYEDLRRQVLEEPAGSGWGRSLFMRRGLLAWMEAWPPDNDSGAPPVTPAAPTAVEMPALSSGLYQEMTRILVDMILHSKEE